MHNIVETVFSNIVAESSVSKYWNLKINRTIGNKLGQHTNYDENYDEYMVNNNGK